MTTNPSHLPRPRLNEIARRKLATLNVEARLSPDGQALEGWLPAAGLVNPFSGTPIATVRFVAEGHDHLRLLQPEILARMPPLKFYELHRIDELWAPVAAWLRNHFLAVQKTAARLQPMRLPLQPDAERGVFYATADIEHLGRATLEGDDTAIRLVHFVPLRPDRRALRFPRTSVDIGGEIADRVDLELAVASLVDNPPEGAVEDDGEPSATASAPAVPTPDDAAALVDVAPPEGALTLGMLVARFGANAVVGPGCVIEREMSVAGRRVRFRARHVERAVFQGALSTATGLPWQEHFDATSFPGVDGMVNALREVIVGPPSSEVTPPQGSAIRAASLRRAAAVEPGQVWLLRARVVAHSSQAVQYVALRSDGTEVGPHTVASQVFADAFRPLGAEHVLAVRVLAADAERCTYVQLSPADVPAGEPRTVELGEFVRSFFPPPPARALALAS